MIIIGTTTIQLPNGITVTARVLIDDSRHHLDTPDSRTRERGIAWQRRITAEHRARFGMAAGCRHVSGLWKPRG